MQTPPASLARHLCATALLLGAAAFGPNRLHAQDNTERCRGGTRSDLVVLYVNGIWNTREEALASCRLLGSQMTAWGITAPVVELFYNRTQEWKCSPGTLPPGSRPPLGQAPKPTGSVPLCVPVTDGDLLEAIRQMDNLASSYRSPSAADAVLLGRIINGHFAAGRKVVVLSHSQGNLMFQEALYGLERSIDRSYAPSSLAWLSVASPYLTTQPNIAEMHAIILSSDALRIGARAGDLGKRALGTNVPRVASFSEIVAERILNGQVEDAETFRNLTLGTKTNRLGLWKNDHSIVTYLTDPVAEPEMRAALARLVARFANQASGPTSSSRILLVLDVSRSMIERGKMDAAIREARRLVLESPPTANIALATFGGACSAQLVAQSSDGREQLLAAIDGLQADGNTPLSEAINGAAAIVEQSGVPYEYHVVVITDGLETCGGDWTVASRRLGAALRLIRIP